jgi:UDP-N-acetylmuramate--alanine ligase
LTLDDLFTSGAKKTVYFIGIGGIGMSAIARYFLSKGVAVSGYDKTESIITKELVSEGAIIHYDEDVNAIPKDAVFVVYTPAVPKDHAELVYYQENNYPVVKRSDVLEAITADNFNICIAGTHGKTTITTLTSHILRDSGYGCTAFLGGISVNYDTNFWASDNNVYVVEADEYDRSFLKLKPKVAVITAMDADHLDIYGDEKTMQDAFIAFGNRTNKDGLLIHKFGLGRIKEVELENKLSYSLQNESADAYASNIRIKEGGYVFDVVLKDKTLEGLELRVGGMHNVENAVAAISVANFLEIDEEKISKAVAAFKGLKRRFQYIIPPKQKEKGAFVEPVLIDDYAHHPEELRAVLNSIRTLFSQRIVTVMFQPHLYTRTRDLAEGFADALSIANRVILLPIYPARELPIEGVSSEIILDKVTSEQKMILSKEQLFEWVEKHKSEMDKEFGEVIVMAGAGDIELLVQPVKEILEK